MFIREITFTPKGEAIIRIPKMMLPPLKLKTNFIILEKHDNCIIIQAASRRLSELKKRRLLDEKRLKDYEITT